jgi:hypothetical protein
MKELCCLNVLLQDGLAHRHRIRRIYHPYLAGVMVRCELTAVVRDIGRIIWAAAVNGVVHRHKRRERFVSFYMIILHEVVMHLFALLHFCMRMYTLSSSSKYHHCQHVTVPCNRQPCHHLASGRPVLAQYRRRHRDILFHISRHSHHLKHRHLAVLELHHRCLPFFNLHF